MAGMMSAAQASHVYVCSTKLQSDFVSFGIEAIPNFFTYPEVEHCRPSIDLLSNLTEISARPSIDLSDFLRRCAHDSKTTSEAVVIV